MSVKHKNHVGAFNMLENDIYVGIYLEIYQTEMFDKFMM